jgi:hypothetical protein
VIFGPNWGKVGKHEATLTQAQVWWFIPISMWIQLYTSTEFESLKSLGMEFLVVPTFYAYGSVVAKNLMMM